MQLFLNVSDIHKHLKRRLSGDKHGVLFEQNLILFR